MAPIERPHVAAPQRLHHVRDAVGGFGREQQMQVVAHQHVGVDGDLGQARLLADSLQETPPILVIQHHGLAVVATQDDVVRVSGNGEAQRACHGELSSKC